MKNKILHYLQSVSLSSFFVGAFLKKAVADSAIND